jgi:hypothetical protein
MSLLSPSRASRTIPEPYRSFLTRCFRLSFQQPSGLYVSVAAPSLPSRSSARTMILARVRSCMCIQRSDVTAFAFTSKQVDLRALSLLSYSLLPLELSTAGKTILERCRSILSLLSPERWMILARVRSYMSIERLDVTALAFTI